MKIDFKSKPIYGDDDKYINTKIKINASSIITNFHNKEIPKEKAPCKCLQIIMLDSNRIEILIIEIKIIGILTEIESITLKHF